MLPSHDLPTVQHIPNTPYIMSEHTTHTKYTSHHVLAHNQSKIHPTSRLSTQNIQNTTHIMPDYKTHPKYASHHV